MRGARLGDPRALAHLARALRTSGDARLPRQYLMSLLREGDWHFPETEPMRHQDVVPAANFSQDGRRIVTASSDKTARVWDVAVDLDLRLPSWVPELAEALGGHKFNEEGRLAPSKSIVELRN